MTTCGQSILKGFIFLTLLDAESFWLFWSILKWSVCHKYTSKRVLTDTCHNNDLVILLHRQGSFARCIILFIGHMCDGLINCHVVFFLSVLQFGVFSHITATFNCPYIDLDLKSKTSLHRKFMHVPYTCQFFNTNIKQYGK